MQQNSKERQSLSRTLTVFLHTVFILAPSILVYLVDIMCGWVKDWPISALREFPVICVKTPENVACAMFFFIN